MADYRSEVGARLRQLREARDLSQEDAAHKVGVTSKTFLRWENGRAWPTPDNWQAIKRYFGADPREGVPSPGPLGLGAHTNGNGQHAPTAADILAEVRAFREESRLRYAQLDAALRAVISAWPGGALERYTLKDARNLLDWLQAGGSEPQSQGDGDRRAEPD